MAKSNGSDEPTESKEHECPICRGARYVHPVKGDGSPDYQRDLVPCVCVREEMALRKNKYMLDWCEMPRKTEHMTFRNFRRRPFLDQAYEAAMALAEEQEGAANWLMFSSEVNRGKTHLAIAICRRWLERGKLAKYSFVPLLLEELRRGFGQSGDQSYEERFDRFLRAPLLVLDDLGTENRTPWVQEKLDTLVDYRLMHGLALVVTTNLTLEELPARISSRLERGGRVIGIKGDPYSAEE